MTGLQAVVDGDEIVLRDKEHLFELVNQVDADINEILIVVRLSDASGLTYAQTMKDNDCWIVGRQDGSLDEHYHTYVPSAREVEAIIASWAFGLPEGSPPDWTKIGLG